MPSKKPPQAAAKKAVQTAVKKTAVKAVKKIGTKVVTTAAEKAAPKAAPKATAKAKPAMSAVRLGLDEVMGILEKAGSEQARKTYARHGAKGPMFGVRFGDLFTLMKRIGVDHELARALWATGNVDARNLAMKIADPQLMTPDELDRWTIENEMGICGLYVASLAAEGPHGRSKVRAWTDSKDVRLRAMGWTLVSRLSDLDESYSDEELSRAVSRIETSIHAAPNAERAEMNRALISIGGRNAALRKTVTAAAKRIGPVKVDHGDTACATPDAVASIDKAWERSGKKFPSPAAAERSRESMRRRC